MSSDGGATFAKLKGLELKILYTNDGEEKENVMATVKDHDISKFVGHKGTVEIIQFTESELANTFVKIKWSI